MKKLIFLPVICLVISLLSFKSGTESVLVIKTSVVCNMCKERIERELVFEKGVKEVEVDVKARTVTVHYRTDKTNPEKIRTALSKLGYKADDKPADKKGYAKLPECCKAEGCGK